MGKPYQTQTAAVFLGRPCISPQNGAKPLTASIITAWLWRRRAWCWTGLQAVQTFNHPKQFDASWRVERQSSTTWFL